MLATSWAVRREDIVRKYSGISGAAKDVEESSDGISGEIQGVEVGRTVTSV